MKTQQVRAILWTALLAPLGALAVEPTAGRTEAGTELARSCANLASLMKGKWPDDTTRLQHSEWHGAGVQENTFAGPVTLPAHCDLTGVMQERVGLDGQHYAIRFHLRLPEQWRDRFFFEGGGGTEGDLGAAVGLVAPGTPLALDRGYAVVSQDSGHDNAIDSVPTRGGAVAFGFDPQARSNYGGSALQPVAAAAKALIRTFYGRDIKRSYFVGCSKGGQEGMAFAQRFPDVFDGIVAGAPGFSLPRAAIAEAWDTQAFASLITRDVKGIVDAKLLPKTFSDAQFSSVRAAVLAACDADDGARDGITAALSACTWPKVATELNRKICAAAPDDSCLSRTQIEVLHRVYQGPQDSAGHPLYSDWVWDAGIGSDGWRAWKIGAAGGPFPGINVAMGAPALAAIFTTPPTALDANPQTSLEYALRFNFDRDAQKIDAQVAPFQRSAWQDISARSPDLSRFRQHGGKMIVPQGASDPVFSLNDTLAWYRQVDQLNKGHASEFVRIFPVPGMAHCAGGPATDQFDAFGALVDWVEKGIVPEHILAKAGPHTPWPGRSRPLCAYPKMARYNGSGSLESADSFHCE